jgi:hypothetical protein
MGTSREVVGRVLRAHAAGLERRAEGKTKSRLVPDPLRAPIVHLIVTWRIVDRLGYAEITDRLNADLDRYPSPLSPDPARQRDHWSRYSVREILLNPKYTGYMVWNRRSTKKGGKVNPPETWVWSAEPTHEPIVSREMFEAAMGTARTRQGSATEPTPTWRIRIRNGVTSSAHWWFATFAAAACSERRGTATPTTHANRDAVREK